MAVPKFIVVRSDVADGSGQQRVFLGFDDEAAAVTHAMQTAGTMYGDFAVVEVGRVAYTIVREGGIQAVRVEPTTPSE